MDDLLKLSAALEGEEIIYVYCDPQVDHFLEWYEGKIVVATKSGIHTVSIPTKFNRSLVFFNLLFRTIFGDKRTILTWNIKPLISFVRYHCKRARFNSNALIFDLRYTTMFLGKRSLKRPQTFENALDLYKLLSTHCSKISENVLVPLSTSVLPDIETAGIGHGEDLSYSFYEIEGQVNGRLSASAPSKRFLNPHTLSAEDKEKIKIPASNQWFIVLDYQHMEIAVLQWLSGDKELELILDEHLYEKMSEVLFDKVCMSDEDRSSAKVAFIAAVYGMQSENSAKIESRFPASMGWLKSKQEAAGNIAQDYFGRRRDFTGIPAYKRRSLAVQSPAALICLHKLVCLHSILPNSIIFHIHDGYVLRCADKDLLETVKKSTVVLESASELYPGLALKTKCKIGRNLNKLTEFPRKFIFQN